MASLVLLSISPGLAQAGRCTRYWFNSQTGQMECLDSDGSQSAQPVLDWLKIPLAPNAQVSDGKGKAQRIKQGMSFKEVLVIMGTPPAEKQLAGNQYIWKWLSSNGEEHLGVTINDWSFSYSTVRVSGTGDDQSPLLKEQLKQVEQLQLPVTLEQVEQIAGRKPDVRIRLYDLTWNTTDQQRITITVTDGGVVSSKSIW